MVKSNKNEYRLRIGNAIIGIICHSPRYMNSMINYFGLENTAHKPDIQLKLNIIPHKNNLYIPNSLFTDKIIKGNNFIMGNNIVTGFLNEKERTGELNVKKGLTVGQVTRVFEQILYQAYYSAQKIIKDSSFLVHSSGVIYKNSGFLFFGPSESGKSTVANLSRQFHVLNDEICLISINRDKVCLNYTPFNGLYEYKKPGHALLKAIFYLEQSKIHRITDLKNSLAVKLLAKEIVPPVGLNDLMQPAIFADMIDMAKKLYDSTRVKKLEFLPDNGFWKEIDKLFFNEEK